MKKTLLTIGSLAILLTAVLSVHAAPAQAASLSGWAWSSNIGWISFNWSDTGAGGGPYSVSVDPSSGDMSGYAWSSNLGWLSFNAPDLSGCSGTQAPAVNLTTGAVTGWARFLAGAGRTDGWDGCVELSGTNHPSPDLSGASGVTMNPSTGAFNGYAWGGNVVGWIDFAPSLQGGGGVTCTNSCGPGGNLPITGTCTATPSTIASGGSVSFILSGIEDPNSGTKGTYSYVWETGVGNVTNSLDPYNNFSYPSNNNTTPVIYSTSVKVIDSANNSSVISCGQVTVDGTTNTSNAITLGIGNTPSTATRSALQISQGNPFALAWNISSLPPTYSCSPFISNNGSAYWSSWNSTAVSGGTSITLSTDTNTNKGTYQFTLSCSDSAPTNPGPNVSSSVNLVVTQSTETEF